MPNHFWGGCFLMEKWKEVFNAFFWLSNWSSNPESVWRLFSLGMSGSQSSGFHVVPISLWSYQSDLVMHKCCDLQRFLPVWIGATHFLLWQRRKQVLLASKAYDKFFSSGSSTSGWGAVPIARRWRARLVISVDAPSLQLTIGSAGGQIAFVLVCFFTECIAAISLSQPSHNTWFYLSPF